MTCSRDELRWHGGRLYVEDDTDTALELLTQLRKSFHNIRWREWCLDKFFSVNAIVEAFSDYCENFRKVSLTALHMSAAAAPCLLLPRAGRGQARSGTLLGSPDSIPDGGLARNCAVPSSRGSRGRNL